MIKIEISKYRSSGAKIFTGRDNGIEARKELKIDELESKYEKITVIIPSDTWGINSSFFSGLFETSIKADYKAFLDRYQFTYNNGKELDASLRDNIDRDIKYVLDNI